MARRAFSDAEREKILAKTDCKCAHCGKKLTVDTMTVEHIFPVDKGGSNGEYNLIALCERCNFEKSNRIYNIEDYYKYIPRENRERFIKELDKNIMKIANPRKSIMTEEVRIYKYVNDKMDMLLMNMCARVRNGRGRSRKSYEDMARQLSTSTVFERAYEAESEEIAQFLQKMKKIGKYNSEMYDSDYKIRELILFGQVYTYRAPDKTLKGVVGFFNLLRNKETVPFQIQNAADIDDKEVLLMLTLNVFDKGYGGMARAVFDDLIDDFIRYNIKIIAFTENEEVSEILRHSSKVINMPWAFRQTQGFIQSYTCKGEREALEHIQFEKESFEKSVENKTCIYLK